MTVRFFTLLTLCVTTVAAGASDETRPAPVAVVTIRWNAGGAGRASSVEVVGLDSSTLATLADADWDPSQWAQLFSISVVPAERKPSGSQPPIVGAYRVAGSALSFAPRFPFEHGIRYRARFRPSQLPKRAGDTESDREITSEFIKAAPPPTAPAFVARVDPGSDRLPENLLKFYLHFSRPMSRGKAYAHIHLLDGAGVALISPFLELGEELWDPTGTRLTMLLDPGRIKRGLRPREEEGPILEAGKTYALVIDREWLDAEGYPLKESYRKSFRAGPADELQPATKSWKIEPPRGGTREALSVTFPEPLDRAMLDRVILVHDPRGRVVKGEIEVNEAATRWRFRPEQAWSPYAYQLVVDSELEDLAGNSIARPFEVDVLHRVTERLETRTVSVPFEVR